MFLNQFPESPLPSPALLLVDSRNTVRRWSIWLPIGSFIPTYTKVKLKQKSKRNYFKKKKRKKFAFIFFRLLDLLSITFNG
jgi:hypothetical protein